MLRFIYSLADGEELDPSSLRVEEFDGFEAADKADHGVNVTGRRCADLDSALAVLQTGTAQWAVFRPATPWRELARRINQLEIPPTLLIEPWLDCSAVQELWQFSETLRPAVKIAWPASWGTQTGQAPAAVIPVLNLRIGLVRVADASAATIDFAKRLAGIGFDGYFVVDPPAGEDRLGEARKIAEIARDITQPRKPAKAVAKKA